jgi:hypothetical protein
MAEHRHKNGDIVKPNMAELTAFDSRQQLEGRIFRVVNAAQEGWESDFIDIEPVSPRDDDNPDHFQGYFHRRFDPI